MKTQITKIALSLLLSLPLAAASEPAEKTHMGPVLKNYGPIVNLEKLDVPLDKTAQYKVVFDVYETASDMDVHSRRLESVARYINMHVDAGVPLENLHIAVVFHGKATKDILLNSIYQEKFGTPNPNAAMIADLAAVGVDFSVCGQSSVFAGYQREDILPEIKIALSAMTQLTVLQSKGYALLP